MLNRQRLLLSKCCMPNTIGSTIRLTLAVMLSIAFMSGTFTEGKAEDRIQQLDRKLDRGINLGGALEAPVEGAWGVTLKSEYFQTIQNAGFKSVRIPIRWSSHAMAEPPYTIAPEFFARIDWAIGEAFTHNLTAIIDLHHYGDLYAQPAEQVSRLLRLWRQIAAHYQSFSDNLYFELVNEPHDGLTDERWEAMIPPLLRTVRDSNPDRAVIIGPGYWNSLDHLDQLQLPDDDKNLIVTFHYYVPMRFTHQGASWVAGADQWKDVTWMGTREEEGALRNDFDKVSAWGLRNGRPLYLGEFGSYQMADMGSRARWTHAVAREAEEHGISWAYWEFCSAFGAYDPEKDSWREPLLHALLPR
jgi:endoglucanase